MFGRTFRVRLSGDWQDAWLYKDALLLWGRQNTCYRIPIEQFQRLIDREVGTDLGPLFELAFFRNEWKAGEQYKRLTSVPAVAKSILDVLEANFGASDAALTLKPPLDELPIEPVPGIILDTEVYANRVFIGTTQGAYETRYIPGFSGEPQPTSRLSDHRTSGVSAKYSSLNVSAGNSGLLFKAIQFGAQDDHRVTGSDTPLRRVADVSDSTAFASRNLLNYWGGPVPTLFRSRGHKAVPHDRARHESFAIDGYEEAEQIDDLAWRAFASPKAVVQDMDQIVDADRSDIEILGNSGHRLLVAAAGVVGVLDIGWKNGRHTHIARSSLYGAKQFPISRKEILSTHQLGTNFLVEEFDSVSLVSPDGVRPIFAGQAASIRTFSDSVRFREVALIVTDDSLEIVGTL